MIKKIFSTSDQHFFLAKKFEEHQYVCEQFYKEIEKEKPDLVVLAGDLIDSKLRLGPEQIDLARNFIKNITNYCPAIVILGNHDLNLANKERTDSLSPILHSLYAEVKYPIHFLKHSDIYTLYGINWAVWSCLDDQKNPFDGDGIHKSNHYTIGVYHGAVKGCISDNGFILSDGVDINEFKECDRVILGDIHKQQGFRNNEIVYNGSFIQTKINEDPAGTFLQWDWDGENFNASVKSLQNIYSTIVKTVDEDFDFDSIETISDKQTIVLRYDADVQTKIDIQEAKKKLETLVKNPVEIKKIVKKRFKIGRPQVEEKEEEVFDLKGYLVEYVRTNSEALNIKSFEEDISKILALDDTYSANLDISKDFELGDFSLERVVLNNFLSFPAHPTTIDLDRQGIVGINAPNRTGKSNLLRSIQFALFNFTPNNIPLKKLINKHNRDKECSVELFLTKNGKYYYIKRTIVPKKKEGVTIRLQFLQIDNDGMELANLVGEKRQDTEKEIQKLFGIESMFEILSVFSAQKKQTEFIDCKNAERLTLVNRFLGLHSFEQKEKEVAEELKKDKAVFQALLKEFNSNVSIDELELAIKQTQDKYDEQVPLVKVYEEALENLISTNKSLLELYEETKVAANKRVTSPEETKERKAALQEKIDKIQKTIATTEDALKHNTEYLQEIKDAFFERTKEDVKSYKPNYKIAKQYEGELAVTQAEIKRLNKQLDIDTCNSCGKEFTESDKKKVQERLKELEDLPAGLQEMIDAANEHLDEVIKIQEEYNTVGRRMSNFQNSILTSKNDLDKLLTAAGLVKNEVEEYNAVQKAKKVLAKLEPQIEIYQTEKSTLEKDKINIVFEINQLQKEIGIKQKELIVFKEKKKELEELEEELRLLKTYKDIIRKDGLPIYILKSKMSAVNEQINLIISQVFDFEVQFSVDEEAGELSVDFIYDGDVENNDVSLASGAETFLINICIKVGLSQVSELPKMNTLIIDEGYGSLDREVLEKIPALFNALTEYYKNIITVSHLDEVKDMCTHQIKLEKVGKYTQVIY